MRSPNRVCEGVQAHHKGRKRHKNDDVVPLSVLRRQVRAWR